MGQAVVYIDGMNLYHGIKAKYGRKYLWLDLFALAAQLRRPDTIIRVWYFTTIVAGEPEAARRQETYLAALTSFSHDHLAASLLPDAVPGRKGQVYHRPDKWR